MNSRKKLQSVVINGLDGLEHLVQREQSRQASEAASSPASDDDDDKKEVFRLKQQMEQLFERINDLCARIEARENANGQSLAGFPSRSRPLPERKLAPIRGFEGLVPSLLEKCIRLSQFKDAKRARRWRAASLVALLAGGLAIWLRLGLLHSGVGQVAIESDPAKADVFIDNQFRGQTPLQLRSIRAGNYRVRISKEGYEPLVHEVRLSRGETARVDIRLNELSAADLQMLARSLFNQGKLREADRICNLLFQTPPYDAFALDLKEKILTGLLAQISPQGLAGKTSGTELASRQPWKSSVLPNKEQSDKIPPSESGFVKNGIVTTAQISQPSRISSNRDPQAGAAQRPIQSSGLVSPEKSFKLRVPVSQVSTADAVQRQPEPVDKELLDRIKNRIQSKHFLEARSLLQQLPVTSQPAVQLKNLLEVAEADVQKQRDLVSSALQKAESALIAGHYITPPDDNVVVHCNRGLGFDPQNQRLLALKNDVIQRSIVQVRDWIQRGKFEQARASYSSLSYLSQNDTGFPVRRQWFQEELNKLEFASYPVIHEHKFGSCSGRLRMNAHVLSFVPSRDSSHGFTEPLRSVMVTEGGETLRVRLVGKSFQFHPNSNQESGASRQAFQAVSDQLMDLVAKATH